MIDAACNFVGDYPNKCASDRLGIERNNVQRSDSDLKSQTMPIISAPSIYPSNFASAMLATKPPIPKSQASAAKVQTVLQSQYPPQTSSTGSTSPNSNLSASVSPTIFPSPTSFPSSPPNQNVDLGGSYTWNPYARTQFPYAQYAAPDYYGNMGMSAGPSWFAHQAWPSNSYGSYTFDDIAFQTQLQRRTVRCACPNCTNELSGLPPIVGPDDRGRKQHICHIPGCERLYGKASHLKTHLRWHTGERPFVCLSCGKRFSRSDELQRHGRTHTNYRPYGCPICSKKFSRSDHLSKHKKTHFKDKKNKKSTPAEEKSSAKKIENATTSDSPQKPAVSTSGALPQTAHKTVTTSASYPPEVPSGYNPYQSFYQSSALFNQHQHTSELSIQNQQSNSSNYYSPANMGEATTTTSFANLPHMQYDPLQAMGQSAASYAVKSDTYPSYSELISNGMMGSSPPTTSNFSLHHPWNAHNYQN